MRNVPVVADLASQHKQSGKPAQCVECGSLLSGVIGRHVCESCGFPQPLSTQQVQAEDYFEALGAPRRFFQNQAEIEKKFYELSRALHPDRFGNSNERAKQNSLQRMSFINQAYETLKNPSLLRDYILQKEGIDLGKQKSQVPAELAEDWFEVQDLLAEDPERALAVLESFEAKLKRIQDESVAALETLERELDERMSHLSSDIGDSQQGFQTLAREIQHQSYLRSMAKDVESLKSRRERTGLGA